MRIAILSTPFLPVPPPRYGGTELVVAELVDGLVARGHTVTLFATGDSQSRGEVRALYPTPRWPPHPYPELHHAAWSMAHVARERSSYDLLHAHVPAAVALAPFVGLPMLCTLHHERDPRLIPLYQAAAVHFIAISKRQRQLSPELRDVAVIHHGLSPERYPYGDGAGDYAAFLGRFAREKGVHAALDVAALAELPIRLAGAAHFDDGAYASVEVEPRLGRSGVERVGELDPAAKAALLGGARALLFPIDWEEPFGLVMIEAMMCGTPVLAFDRGATGEVIEHGVTGFLCTDVRDMAARLRTLRPFDRRRCRAAAIARWSASRMVDEHVALYRQLVE